MTLDWNVLNALIQWIILPAIAWLWAIHGRVSAHEKATSERFGAQDKEIIRLLTILEEREKARATLRQGEIDAIAELHKAIKSMNERLDHLSESIARMQGRDM